MSPSFSTRFFDGMPCTISWFTDAQMLPGNPYSPLNAGIAPSWLRMNSSAICVELAGGHARPHGAAQMLDASRPRIFPPCAIRSISRADLS